MASSMPLRGQRPDNASHGEGSSENAAAEDNFITVTDPRSFLSKKTQQKIRSLVMFSYLDKQDSRTKASTNAAHLRSQRRKRASRAKGSSRGEDKDAATLVHELVSGVYVDITKPGSGLVVPEQSMSFVHKRKGAPLNGLFQHFPLDCAPQFADSSISSTELFHHCQGANSTELLTARAEVLSRINTALKSPKEQLRDMTFAAVIHQLFVDIAMGDYEVIDNHLTGLEAMVRAKGGLHMLGLDGEVAQTLLTQALMTCILYERKPPDEYLAFEPTKIPYLDPVMITPSETPAYWEGEMGLPDLAAVQNCSQETHNILVQMQHLTNILLNASVFDSNVEKQCQSIYQFLLNQPSALQPKTPVSNDWVYESCRIGSLLLAGAAANRVPISRGVPIVLRDSASPSMLSVLLKALSKPDIIKTWEGISGCYLWVALIGGCAGRHWDLGSGVNHLARLGIRMPAMICAGLFSTPKGDLALGTVKNLLHLQRVLERASVQDEQPYWS